MSFALPVPPPKARSSTGINFRRQSDLLRTTITRYGCVRVCTPTVCYGTTPVNPAIGEDRRI